jgi:hypothetical protein
MLKLLPNFIKMKIRKGGFPGALPYFLKLPTCVGYQSVNLGREAGVICRRLSLLMSVQELYNFADEELQVVIGCFFFRMQGSINVNVSVNVSLNLQ